MKELPQADGSEVTGEVIGYMCLIDWQHEIGQASDGNLVYPSIQDLKHNHPCWKSCGIAEVEIRIRSVICEGGNT